MTSLPMLGGASGAIAGLVCHHPRLRYVGPMGSIINGLDRRRVVLLAVTALKHKIRL